MTTITWRYDGSVDAGYLTLTDEPVARTEELANGLLIDRDANDQIVGIEILAVSENAL